jgi:hypothetical protein
MAALLFGIEEDRLGAAISAGLAPQAGAATAGRVAAVRISVPLAGLASEPDPEGRRARLRLVVGVRGVEGATEALPELREQEVLILLPHGDATAATERHEIVVDVPLGDGPHDIAVGVHDALSSLASYRRLRVN